MNLDLNTRCQLFIYMHTHAGWTKAVLKQEVTPKLNYLSKQVYFLLAWYCYIWCSFPYITCHLKSVENTLAPDQLMKWFQMFTIYYDTSCIIVLFIILLTKWAHYRNLSLYSHVLFRLRLYSKPVIAAIKVMMKSMESMSGQRSNYLEMTKIANLSQLILPLKLCRECSNR